MEFNQKGDFILYLIFTIVILLIGAILYYVYLGSSNNSDGLPNLDGNFLNEFKSKLPNNDPSLNDATYSNSYSIVAKLNLDMPIQIYDKNLNILGNPIVLINKRKITVKDPLFTEFTGNFTKEGMKGELDSIIAGDSGETNIELKSQFESDFTNIEEISVNDIYLDLENSNIKGKVTIQDKAYDLNKSYLKIKGFKGKLTIVPNNDNNSAYVKLDGNVGYFEMIDNQIVTTLK